MSTGVMQLVLSLQPGGTERLVVEICKRLVEPFRPVVCCLDEAGELAGELEERGIPIVALHRAPGFQPALGARIATIAKRYGASVVHCHHYSPFVYGAIASLLAPRLELIFTEHGRLSDAPPTLKRRVANVGFARVRSAIFAVSGALKEHLASEGFPASRIGVIYNGIHPGAPPRPADRVEARRRLGIADEAFLVGTAARLDPVKDFPTLIAAAARLRARVPSLQLVIAGEGPERAALEDQIRAGGLGGCVHLLGYRAEVRDLLPGFDAFVNSSITEGISLTILEAMAAGLPVAATRVGGTPEVLVDGETGLLVDARSPDALARALGHLAEIPERRRAMGTAGRARLERMFTVDRMVADYTREYARLARN